MSLKNEVDALYLAALESGNIRYLVHPAGAPVAIVSDGAAAANAYPAADLHIQILAAGVIADPCWLIGVVILNNDLEVACFADLAIGFGVDAAGIDRAEFAYFNELAAVAAMTLVMYPIMLPYPVKIIGSPRVAGRIRKSSAASGVGITPKVIFATAVGT